MQKATNTKRFVCIRRGSGYNTMPHDRPERARNVMLDGKGSKVGEGNKVKTKRERGTSSASVYHQVKTKRERGTSSASVYHQVKRPLHIKSKTNTNSGGGRHVS